MIYFTQLTDYQMLQLTIIYSNGNTNQENSSFGSFLLENRWSDVWSCRTREYPPPHKERAGML